MNSIPSFGNNKFSRLIGKSVSLNGYFDGKAISKKSYSICRRFGDACVLFDGCIAESDRINRRV